jgi:hypothetical protein
LFVTTVRLSEETRRRLALVAALETLRCGRRVAVADLIRKGIDMVTTSADLEKQETSR